MTVVIPTHNRAVLLTRALRSVFAQQEVEFEIVVVDDGSTDDTPQLLAAVADPRLRVLRNEQPQRVSAARNRGIEAARGDWVALLDDDDLWAPDKLAKQLRATVATGAQWSYTGFVQVDKRLVVLAGEAPPDPDQVLRQLPFKNVLAAGASVVMARRELLAELRAFDIALGKLEDWDLWIRLAATGRPACASEPLAAYVEHAGMASLDTSGVLSEARKVEANYAAARGGRPIDSRSLYRWVGWCSLRGGNRLDACKAYARSASAGDLSSVARAGVALVSPGRAMKLAKRPYDAQWAARAATWLAPFIDEVHSAR